MIRWMRNWWRERNRKIFRFWDGARVRRVDPIVVFRALRLVKDFDLENDLTGIASGDDSACARAIAATRMVFGIQPWNEEDGLTEDETLDVLASFVLWWDELKKNSSPLPISPVATVPSPASSVSSTADTTQSSACTPTSGAKNCAEQVA
jgi:hypothetical protein